ncbi:hypothetical protein VTH06DRAFT_393 [Thermothelomyces fergusii]
MPLNEVMEVMKNEHNFFANKRQYTYRLAKWDVEKNNRRKQRVKQLRVIRIRPSFDHPALGPNDGWPKTGEQQGLSPASLFWLANTLPFLGDFRNVGRIVMEQWERNPSGAWLGPWLSAGRAKMTPKVGLRVAKPVDAKRYPKRKAWEMVCYELRYAYTYYGLRGKENCGDLQVKDLVDRIVDRQPQGTNRIQQLRPRVPGLDTLAYVLFRSALVRYNSLHPDNPSLDVDGVLDQFVDQHLSASRSGSAIGCLSSCLEWCATKLGERNASGLRPVRRPSARSLFSVLCNLWRHLWDESGGLYPGGAGVQAGPDWASAAEHDLGIGAPYLLGIVACMITAAGMQESRPASALLRLRGSGRPGEDKLLQAFLRQACAVAWPLAGLEDGDPAARPFDIEVEENLTARYCQDLAQWLGVAGLPPPA